MRIVRDANEVLRIENIRVSRVNVVHGQWIDVVNDDSIAYTPSIQSHVVSFVSCNDMVS